MQFLRYRDLVDRGIVRNRVTLKNWIRNLGFPAGRLIGPNSRAWSESEVEAWLDSRPSTPKAAPRRKTERAGAGRP
jgi:predicted DNA-binding transcriptional regulator AlpA